MSTLEVVSVVISIIAFTSSIFTPALLRSAEFFLTHIKHSDCCCCHVDLRAKSSKDLKEIKIERT